MRTAAALAHVASALLAFVAVVLFVLAFTRFGPPEAGQDQESYDETMVRDARLSVVLGIAGCFALLGAFACHERGRRLRQGDGPPVPQP